MPISEEDNNPYINFGISLKEVNIIYSYPWKDQMNILMNFLYEETSDPVFLLPHHPCEIKEIHHINSFLREIYKKDIYLKKPFFIGKRIC